MAKSLSQYYGAKAGVKTTGNKRLSEFYGDKGQGYTSARQIADEFAANMDEYPRLFRRSFIADKLRLGHDRELSLLSDALYTLRRKGLIEFDPETNQWKNLQKG